MLNNYTNERKQKLSNDPALLTQPLSSALRFIYDDERTVGVLSEKQLRYQLTKARAQQCYKFPQLQVECLGNELKLLDKQSGYAGLTWARLDERCTAVQEQNQQADKLIQKINLELEEIGTLQKLINAKLDEANRRHHETSIVQSLIAQNQRLKIELNQMFLHKA